MSKDPKKSNPPALSNRRRRAHRARTARRALFVGAMIVLALGLVGLGIALLPGPRVEPQIEVYPLDYEAQIRLYARENGLDPAWPAAVILAESSYDPGAVSSANAQGLKVSARVRIRVIAKNSFFI